jgi:hypothetical protein
VAVEEAIATKCSKTELDPIHESITLIPSREEFLKYKKKLLKKLDEYGE